MYDRGSKYHNIPTFIDGTRFHSRKEGARYCELKLLLSAGAIRNLTLQPSYVLVVNGVKIAEYRGDFLYEDCKSGAWAWVLEDVKSEATRTPVYQIKKRLVKAIYDIDILET